MCSSDLFYPLPAGDGRFDILQDLFWNSLPGNLKKAVCQERDDGDQFPVGGPLRGGKRCELISKSIDYSPDGIAEEITGNGEVVVKIALRFLAREQLRLKLHQKGGERVEILSRLVGADVAEGDG